MQKILVFALVVCFIAACSSSQQTEKPTEDKGNNIYVFDDVNSDSSASKPAEETVQTEVQDSVSEDTTVEYQYIVQVGAFTSMERADAFVKENKDKLKYKTSISYSDKVKLYVVQFPPFATREEAEKVRNDLWQTKEFKDAFIITEQK